MENILWNTNENKAGMAIVNIRQGRLWGKKNHRQWRILCNDERFNSPRKQQS